MSQLLEERLREYSESNYYGFHMPGHKRNKALVQSLLPYELDITEIEGFDDLHHPEELLLHKMKEASTVFKAEESHYLVNGSTCGNISALFATTERGDKVLIARNNHKSVYNGVVLNGLQPIYIYPQIKKETGIISGITANDVEILLKENSDIKAIFIVSPTYEGVISDVEGIAQVAEIYGIPLIVDEAHGSHLGQHPYFHKNANELGADIVVHSLHKTLPSLTQTALLHVNGSKVNRSKLKKYLSVFQSSSPSYLLMSSIDQCVKLLEIKGQQLFDEYVSELESLREALKGMKHLVIIEELLYDKSKIVISTKKSNITSKELYEILLKKYQLQMEMVGHTYLIAMTSVGDTREGLSRLQNALLEIDAEISYSYDKDQQEQYSLLQQLPRLEIDTDGKEGSEHLIYLYPPGIPIVAIGEIITKDIEEMIEAYGKAGFTIRKG